MEWTHGVGESGRPAPRAARVLRAPGRGWEDVDLAVGGEDLAPCGVQPRQARPSRVARGAAGRPTTEPRVGVGCRARPRAREGRAPSAAGDDRRRRRADAPHGLLTARARKWAGTPTATALEGRIARRRIV